MSKTPFKENLMNALKVAVDHFNQGLDPNVAVTKTAETFDFNVDQTTRLIETFNTARTIYHYKKASDRTTPFDLADASVIIPALFSTERDQEKAAGLLPDYTDYNVPEANYADSMMLDKVAAVQALDVPEPRDFGDRDLNALSYSAVQMINIQRDLADTMQHEANMWSSKAATCLGTLANQLGRGYEEVCVERYGRLQSAYRDDVELAPVMSKLAEFMAPHIAKQADTNQQDVIDDTDLDFELSVLKDAQASMMTAAELEAVAQQLTKEADDFERQYIEVLNLPAPQEGRISDFFRSDVVVKQAAAPNTPAAAPNTPADTLSNIFGFGKKDDKGKADAGKADAGKATSKPSEPGFVGALQEGIRGGIKTPLADFLATGIGDIKRGPAERANKQLSERLKNTQRQIMLQELITTDPVLSEEDPVNIANAYSTVMRLAPELSTNKEVVRAILRSAVHSTAVSPYDAASWADLEKNIMQITGKMPMPGAAPVRSVK